VRRRSGTYPLDRGLEELLSFGAGHAREPGGEAAASSGWPGAECEGGFWIEERVASSVDLEDPEEGGGNGEGWRRAAGMRLMGQSLLKIRVGLDYI